MPSGSHPREKSPQQERVSRQQRDRCHHDKAPPAENQEAFDELVRRVSAAPPARAPIRLTALSTVPVPRAAARARTTDPPTRAASSGSLQGQKLAIFNAGITARTRSLRHDGALKVSSHPDLPPPFAVQHGFLQERLQPPLRRARSTPSDFKPAAALDLIITPRPRQVSRPDSTPSPIAFPPRHCYEQCDSEASELSPGDKEDHATSLTSSGLASSSAMPECTPAHASNSTLLRILSKLQEATSYQQAHAITRALAHQNQQVLRDFADFEAPPEVYLRLATLLRSKEGQVGPPLVVQPVPSPNSEVYYRHLPDPLSGSHDSSSSGGSIARLYEFGGTGQHVGRITCIKGDSSLSAGFQGCLAAEAAAKSQAPAPPARIDETKPSGSGSSSRTAKQRSKRIAQRIAKQTTQPPTPAGEHPAASQLASTSDLLDTEVAPIQKSARSEAEHTMPPPSRSRSPAAIPSTPFSRPRRCPSNTPPRHTSKEPSWKRNLRRDAQSPRQAPSAATPTHSPVPRIIPRAELQTNTIAAAQHASGTCTPCRWHSLPQGCRNGHACGFCHVCPYRPTPRGIRRKGRPHVTEPAPVGHAFEHPYSDKDSEGTASAGTVSDNGSDGAREATPFEHCYSDGDSDGAPEQTEPDEDEHTIDVPSGGPSWHPLATAVEVFRAARKLPRVKEGGEVLCVDTLPGQPLFAAALVKVSGYFQVISMPAKITLAFHGPKQRWLLGRAGEVLLRSQRVEASTGPQFAGPWQQRVGGAWTVLDHFFFTSHLGRNDWPSRLILANLPATHDPALQTLASAYCLQAQTAMLHGQTGKIAAVIDLARNLAPDDASLKLKVAQAAAARLNRLHEHTMLQERQASAADYTEQAAKSEHAESLINAAASAAEAPAEFQLSVFGSRRRWPVEACKEAQAKQQHAYALARERYALTREDATQQILAQFRSCQH